MKLYLDDLRSPRMTYGDDGIHWTLVRDYASFVKTFDQFYNQIESISFDHDLEPDHYLPENQNFPLEGGKIIIGKTGYDAVCYVERFAHEHPEWPLPEMFVHSANPSGAARIRRAIDMIKLRRQGVEK